MIPVIKLMLPDIEIIVKYTIRVGKRESGTPVMAYYNIGNFVSSFRSSINDIEKLIIDKITYGLEQKKVTINLLNKFQVGYYYYYVDILLKHDNEFNLKYKPYTLIFYMKNNKKLINRAQQLFGLRLIKSKVSLSLSYFIIIDNKMSDDLLNSMIGPSNYYFINNERIINSINIDLMNSMKSKYPELTKLSGFSWLSILLSINKYKTCNK